MSDDTLSRRKRRNEELADSWEWYAFGFAVVLLVGLNYFRDRNCTTPFLWADNFFVAAYTLFFWGATARAYQFVTNRYSVRVVAWRTALWVSLLMAFVGAVVDFSENFWSLGELSKRNACVAAPGEMGGSIPQLLELLKWWFVGINAGLTAAWWSIAYISRKSYHVDAQRFALALDGGTNSTLARAPGFPPELVVLSGVGSPCEELPELSWQTALFFFFVNPVLGRSSLRAASFSRLAVFRFIEDVLLVQDEAKSGSLAQCIRKGQADESGEVERSVSDRKDERLQDAARKVSVVLNQFALRHYIAPEGERFVVAPEVAAQVKTSQSIGIPSPWVWAGEAFRLRNIARAFRLGWFFKFLGLRRLIE